ncbi:MAG: glutamate 5-kinase, partial [Chloroflexi bacterium]|nr:glutamate 5-kinase [Chloroflexota bacterium]
MLTHQLPTLETLPVSSAALRYSRIVVKVGTSTLTAGGDAISPAALRQIGQQIGTLLQRGAIVALVTSGAAAAGRERLGVSVDAKDVPRKQVLAAVGQALLMRQWDQVFRELDVPVAQALLTRQDLSNRQSYLNARTTLLNCFDCRVLPIINEND